MRRTALALAALFLTTSLAGCSGDDDSGVVSDPAPTEATSPPTTTSPSPTDDTYPPFETADYTYDLSVQCFCLGTGVPIEVTVEGGQVVEAVYLQDDSGRGGAKAGDPADKRYWLTINDIIDMANESTAERVDVDWPEGQDYPNQVFIDGRKDVADDEIGYSIGNVRT